MKDADIIWEAITYIEGEGRVNITSLLEANKVENTNNIRADKIACQMEKTGRYVIYWLPNDIDNILVKRNPNFDLNENIQATNNSVKSLNTWLKVTGIFSLLLACVTSFFIIKESVNDNAKDNLSRIDTLLQKQILLLHSLRKSMQGIDTSLQKAVRDSFYVSHLP